MRFVALTRTAIRAVGGIAGLRPTFSRITALRPITARFMSSSATVVHGKYEVKPSARGLKHRLQRQPKSDRASDMS